MLQKVKDFLKARTITTHSIVAAIATLTTLYSTVPEFKALVDAAYADTPSWFHKVAVAGIAIWAVYHPAKG